MCLIASLTARLLPSCLLACLSDHCCCAAGPLWLLPLKWVTQEWYYYYYYFSTVRSRRTREAAEVLLTLLAWIVGITYLCRAGHGTHVWWAFVLPGRIAAATLIFTFDYLPHRPHESLDKYEGTNVTSLAGDVTAPLTPVLLYVANQCRAHTPPHHNPCRVAVPLCCASLLWRVACSPCHHPLPPPPTRAVHTRGRRYQNYHNIHHLIPYLPFYHYSRVWFAHKDRMVALGTKIRPLFPLLVSRDGGGTDPSAARKAQ